MDDDDMDYLQPGFDPSSLTVARLRNLLVRHEIPYNASAKKAQLVDTFHSELAPRARKILSAQARTQRTSRGITDMPSSQETSTAGDDDQDMDLPPARPARSQSPRKRSSRSVRQSTADTLEETPVAKKTSSRRSKQPRMSEDTEILEEPELPTTARRARISEPPQLKVEKTSPSKRSSAAESVFSDENPFQSGSSPPDERRRSSGVHKERRSTSARRKSRTPIIKEEDSFVSSSFRTIELPVSRLKRESSASVMEPGEEFTAEEEEELLQESALAGEDLALTRRQQHAPSRTGGVGALVWPVFLSILIGYAFLYRKEKVELGYCGVGKTQTALEEFEAPEWLSFLQPQCEPCPPHASCYSEMRVKCDADFVLKPHPLSLNGVIPIPPTCEPDGEKVRKVHAVADKAVEELRERRAKFECGELTDEAGKPAPTVEIEEPQLKASVSQKRRRGMSESEFEELWKGAIGEVLSREEVASSSKGNSTFLSSNSLARLPLGCAVRRSARLTLARYRIEAGGLVLVLALLAFARNHLRTQRSDAARVPELVSTTLDRLATEAALYSSGARPEPWISSSRMRDDVLRAEFSAKRREEIWRRVARVVEVNANVRSSVREDRNGEVSRVWEWIGSLPALEDTPDRRRSGRASLLPPFDDRSIIESRTGTPVQGNTGADVVADDVRRWDEGRPVY